MSQAISRELLPIVLIRGFGGIDVQEEIADTHQGFNRGTVYPHKKGENYIYPGMTLQFLRSGYGYTDATNVVGFYPERARPIGSDDVAQEYADDILSQIDAARLPQVENAKGKVADWQAKGYFGGRVVLDARVALQLLTRQHPERSLWVYRYYDLDDRRMKEYGRQLATLIDIICDVTGAPSVNIIAHSMGGLVARALIQNDEFKSQTARINKLVTLGTPHKGISFQYLPDILLANLPEVSGELDQFNPHNQEKNLENPYRHKLFEKHFDLKRTLCIIGTNYHTYDNAIARLLNRLFSVDGDGGLLYNKSDGLVKQKYAVLDGAYCTYVHKCHGGRDSLITSREAYEIATRFFFGDRLVRLFFLGGEIRKRTELFSRFNRPEYYFGVSLKPRGLDYDLFYQSKEAENCYGPYSDAHLNGLKGKPLLEAFLDTKQSLTERGEVVFRLTFYLGERDLSIGGFSDDVIVHRPLYLRALGSTENFKLQYYDNTLVDDDWKDCEGSGNHWEFPLDNPYFRNGRFAIEMESV